MLIVDGFLFVISQNQSPINLIAVMIEEYTAIVNIVTIDAKQLNSNKVFQKHRVLQ